MPTNLVRKPEASELEYFKKNPNVSGMATEDDRVILNPYSKLSKEEFDAVALNETARIAMRKNPELQPDFELTDEQKKMLSSGSYADADEVHRKATVAARILSGDPSAGKPTEEQLQFVDKLRSNMSSEQKPAAMAKGGTVKSQTKRLLAKGGLKHEGGTKDPVSGNNVPSGAMQEEVRDDIPAQLSEGEFVFPADVVRYIGLERLMMMRQAAKKGLGTMEDMGQMSNGEEGSEEEDTAEFESEIDDIIGVLGGREKGEMEEEDEEPREMAEGGMPMPAPAAPMSQTQQAIPMSAPAPAPAPMAAEAPAQGIASEIELPQRVESKPTEGLKSSDIIRNNLSAEATPDQTEMFLKQIAMLETASKAISIRHNDTVVIGFVKDKGVVDPIVFSENEPEEFDQAISVAMDTFKKAGVKRLESSSPDKMTIEYLTSRGLPVEEGTPESGFTWALDL